ncbi:hypothetical protein BKA70DRAFT_1124545, partial [Coprinopsis sp. MPI-PUGE-AT-0042]
MASFQSSHDYMLEWKTEKRKSYLNELLQREAPPTVRKCTHCATADCSVLWRCSDCLGCSSICTTCCRNKHLDLPFHRVEICEGVYYQPSWLWRTGVFVNLCPTRTCSASSGLSTSATPNISSCDDESSHWTNTDDLTFGAKPSGRFYNGRKVITVVHPNGIHYMPFQFCNCNDAPQEEVQLLKMAFYPSTFRDTRTVFTYSLLDNYTLETLECFTSTQHYYSKLHRLTNNDFLMAVPDRTRELRRVGRQWRNLMELRSHGFGHLNREPSKGQLAHFCAACPQPGVNLPDGWEEDNEQWKYTQSIVGDGNMKCVHRYQRSQTNDIYLKSGEGFLTEPTQY